MNLYRPSDLFKFLDEHQLKPKKGLSQNFLIDQNILDKIIKLASLQPNETVVEIGSGPGALTQKLLQAGAKVIAIEKDKGFAKALSSMQNKGNLEIIQQDALKILFPEILSSTTKVIANLPYHITSPLIAKLLQYPKLFSSITIMVQKEVAKRICAISGSKDYSHLTVFIQLLAEAKYGFDVKATCFFPKPKVDSAVVQIFPKNEEIPEGVFVLTKQAFQQKRKMLRSSLADLFPKPVVEQALVKLGKTMTARPQDLNPREFVRLFRTLSN